MLRQADFWLLNFTKFSKLKTAFIDFWKPYFRTEPNDILSFFCFCLYSNDFGVTNRWRWFRHDFRSTHTVITLWTHLNFSSSNYNSFFFSFGNLQFFLIFSHLELEYRATWHNGQYEYALRRRVLIFNYFINVFHRHNVISSFFFKKKKQTKKFHINLIANENAPRIFSMFNVSTICKHIIFSICILLSCVHISVHNTPSPYRITEQKKTTKFRIQTITKWKARKRNKKKANEKEDDDEYMHVRKSPPTTKIHRKKATSSTQPSTASWKQPEKRGAKERHTAMYKYINTYTAEFLHWTGNGKPSTIVFADVFITKWKTNNSTLPDNTNAKLANGSAFFFFSFPFIWIAWIRGLYCVCIRKHVKEHTTNEKKTNQLKIFAQQQ